jgi:hypothetical protein
LSLPAFYLWIKSGGALPWSRDIFHDEYAGFCGEKCGHFMQ